MDSNTVNKEDLDSCQAFHGTSEALLRSEISFWRQMIDCCADHERPAEHIERMEHALALAEYRLSSYFRAHRDICKGSEQPAENVFYLESLSR